MGSERDPNHIYTKELNLYQYSITMKSIGKIQTGKKKGQAAQKCFSPTQQENVVMASQF